MHGRNVSYIGRLDHLRFLAAFMVLMYHTNILFNAPDTYHLAIFDNGYTGVSLFMVISGFILTLITYEKQIDIKSFYTNRVLRIYPIFIVVVSLGYFATPDPRETSVGIDYLMAMLPISNLYRLKYGQYGGHLWSVMVEMQFYFMFPFLAAYVRKAGIVFYIAIIGLMCAMRVIVFVLTGTIYASAYFSMLGSLDMFVIGCLAGILHKRTTDYTVGWYVWPFLLLAINGLLFVAHAAFEKFNASAIWIIWPTIQAISWAGLLLSYVKSSRSIPLSSVFAYLGRISYSIYAWHVIAIMLARIVVPSLFAHPYVVGALFVLPATVLMAAISYYVIELPFLSKRMNYTSKCQLGHGRSI